LWRLPWLIFLHWKWRLPWLSQSGSHHLVSELQLLIQVLSYPTIFLCNLSRFVFCLCYVICFLVCVLLHSCLCLCFVLILVLVTFLFLFLFLVSFRLCVKKKNWLSSVSSKKKKLQKYLKKKRRKEEKKMGVWSLNTKLRQLEDFFFFAENRVPNPLI